MLLAVDGLKIRAARLARGLTQERCCKKAGISLKTLQRMEASLAARPKTVRAVGAVLGVDPRVLAGPKQRRVSLRVVA